MIFDQLACRRALYKKRSHFHSLKVQMAYHRICLPGGGGFYSTVTGDGQAWHKAADLMKQGWFRRRQIKAGQWAGPWERVHNSDT